MNCPNCGDPASEDQKFCEKCGSEIRSVTKPPEKKEQISLTSAPKQTPSAGGNLFDLNRNYYIIKERM